MLKTILDVLLGGENENPKPDGKWLEWLKKHGTVFDESTWINEMKREKRKKEGRI